MAEGGRTTPVGVGDASWIRVGRACSGQDVTRRARCRACLAGAVLVLVMVCGRAVKLAKTRLGDGDVRASEFRLAVRAQPSWDKRAHALEVVHNRLIIGGAPNPVEQLLRAKDSLQIVELRRNARGLGGGRAESP